MARRWAGGPEADKADKDPNGGSGGVRRRWRAERPVPEVESAMSTARTKRRWARWSPEPMAASHDMPTTDPSFLRPPDARADEAVRDRTGWPWITGTPAPSPAPEAAATNGDDQRDDWVPPRRRQFWGARDAGSPGAQSEVVATAELAALPAEMPAVTDEPEHHTGIVEALSELQTRDLDRPKSRRFRRDRMAPRPADYEVAPPVVTEPAPQPPVAEAAGAPAIAEADAAAAVAEVPVEAAEHPAAATAAVSEEPEPARPHRRWFGLRTRSEAEEAAWDAERPKWPWITQATGSAEGNGVAAVAESEAPVALEPEPVIAEAPAAPANVEPVVAEPAPVVAEAPQAPAAEPVVAEPAPVVAEAPQAPVAEPPSTVPVEEAPVAVAAEPEEPVTKELPLAVAAAAVGQQASVDTADGEVTQPVDTADEEITPRRRAMWRRQGAMDAEEGAGAAALAPPDWKAEPESGEHVRDADATAEEDETPHRRALWRRQAAMVPAAEAAGGAGMTPPPPFAEEEDEESARNRWAWLGTKRVAVVILLLLAAEVGYVVHLNTQSSSNKSAPPPVTLAVPPSTTAPSTQAPVPTTAPVATPATTPTTTPKPAPAPAPAVAAKSAAPLVPCTTSDLSVVTTTSGNSVGSPVRITTTITAVHSCIFQPAAVQPGNCPSWIVVDQAGGSQVFPASDQVESCNPPAAQTMNPGSSESVSVSWIPPSGSAGTYQAVGIWGWSGQSGVNQISMPSQPFSVS